MFGFIELFASDGGIEPHPAHTSGVPTHLAPYMSAHTCIAHPLPKRKLLTGVDGLSPLSQMCCFLLSFHGWV